MQRALKICMENSLGTRTIAVALGGDLIEVEHPGNHPIPIPYEYKLFPNPNPLVAAGRPTETPLLPIVHHPIEKLSRKHLTGAPFRAAAEIPVAILAVLVVVPLLLRKWAIVIVVSLSNGSRAEQSQGDGEAHQRFHLILLLAHRGAISR
jgi:hypothetical protein